MSGGLTGRPYIGHESCFLQLLKAKTNYKKKIKIIKSIFLGRYCKTKGTQLQLAGGAMPISWPDKYFLCTLYGYVVYSYEC